MFLTVVGVLVLGFAAYVRLAPSDPARWNVPLKEAHARDFAGGAVREVQSDLTALDKIARSEPRTQVLAGSVEDGVMTYISRTKAWGFPDYTTVWQEGETLFLYGRLRFGRSDFGVNLARLERWIGQL